MEYKIFIFGLILLTALMFSCEKATEIKPTLGNATFIVIPGEQFKYENCEGRQPAFAVMTIVDEKGKALFIEKKFSLTLSANVYKTEDLSFDMGKYFITRFIILDDNSTAIYATPAKSSTPLSATDFSLPVEFGMSKNATEVTLQVLPISANATPEDFGYDSFNYDVPKNVCSVFVNADVKIEIGGIIYENVDALLRVTGYNKQMEMQWTADYEFQGPGKNFVSVEYGFAFYSIELVNKWGTSDRTEISSEEIWKGRANGAAPVTYTLVGKKAARKLAMTVRKDFLRDVQSGNYSELYTTRDLYSYDSDGRLTKLVQQLFSTLTQEFEQTSVKTFFFKDNSTLANKIIGTINGMVSIDYELTSGDFYDHEITLKENGLVWTQVSSLDQDSVLHATYSLSNGNRFDYEFKIRNGNAFHSKTTSMNGELCNYGNFTFDKNINPLRHLGYVDFYFNGFSINNVVSEDLHYLACGFPTAVPVTHEYVYDEEGYPTREIVTFRAGSFDNEPIQNQFPVRSEINYYYTD